MTCVEKKEIFLGGDCLQFGRGELGWGRRRRIRGGEGRQNGDINSYRWNHQWTTSVDDSVGNSDGELVCHCMEIPVHPSVIPLVKSPAKTSTSLNRCFLKFYIFHQ